MLSGPTEERAHPVSSALQGTATETTFSIAGLTNGITMAVGWQALQVCSLAAPLFEAFMIHHARAFSGVVR